MAPSSHVMYAVTEDGAVEDLIVRLARLAKRRAHQFDIRQR